MEQASNLFKTVDRNLQNNHTTANPRYEDASTTEIDNYLERLFLIVADSFNLSSQFPTDNEKAARSEAWARALMGTIPETELQRSFDRAFADKQDGFPVSAYDMKDAYARVMESDRHAVIDARNKFLSETKALGGNDRFECRECYGSGFRQVENNFGHRGVARCNACEYWNFRRERVGY